MPPPPHRGGAGGGRDTNAFFAATLVLWAVSVGFEIGARGRRELAPVVAGFAFFQAANAAVRAAVSRDPLFVNTAVSLLHSSLTSASGLASPPPLTPHFWFRGFPYYRAWDPSDTRNLIFVLVNRWHNKDLKNMFEHEELVGGSWVGAYSALCFSCGYFAYDQLDMLRYRLYSGRIPGILMHHLILLICFTLALYRNVTINYLILTLVCELHSVFLHIRKLRRMAGFRDYNRKIVKLEWVLNWTTFVSARVACHILITYKLIIDAHKFDSGIELPLALFGMAGMNLLNIFLGLDLLKAYTRERNQQTHQD
uniref:TLC domain-containing protein n=1 Tax=Oryza meridionalis TaxID=40149 RepID=A0A0E0CAV7_9ORYZ